MASFEEMDYKYCIICQSPKDNGQIVNKPQRSSYENLLIYLCKLNKINWDILNNNEVALTHLSVDILIKKMQYGIENVMQMQHTNVARRDRITINHLEDANERYRIILWQQFLHHLLHILDLIQLLMIRKNVSFVNKFD